MIPRLLAILVLLLSVAAPPARALESAVVASPRAEASLISESDTHTAGQPLRVALRLRMAKGWYTYWRNPGDAGAPPELEFTLPDGITASPIAWRDGPSSLARLAASMIAAAGCNRAISPLSSGASYSWLTNTLAAPSRATAT